jgi:hypothetical protein
VSCSQSDRQYSCQIKFGAFWYTMNLLHCLLELVLYSLPHYCCFNRTRNYQIRQTLLLGLKAAKNQWDKYCNVLVLNISSSGTKYCNLRTDVMKHMYGGNICTYNIAPPSGRPSTSTPPSLSYRQGMISCGHAKKLFRHAFEVGHIDTAPPSVVPIQRHLPTSYLLVRQRPATREILAMTWKDIAPVPT